MSSISHHHAFEIGLKTHTHTFTFLGHQLLIRINRSARIHFQLENAAHDITHITHIRDYFSHWKLHERRVISITSITFSILLLEMIQASELLYAICVVSHIKPLKIDMPNGREVYVSLREFDGTLIHLSFPMHSLNFSFEFSVPLETKLHSLLSLSLPLRIQVYILFSVLIWV